MRKLALATLALAGLGSAFATVPAHAAVDDPFGLICQFASVTNPTQEAGHQTGQVSGGPLFLLDSTTNLPGSGTLTCRVQVTTSNHTGTGPAVTGHGTGVVTAGPSLLDYTAGPLDFVYLCGEFTDDSDGTTYYWDDTNSVWAANDPTVACGLADSPGSGGGDDPLLPIEELIDSIICPVLAIVFPPEGDIVLPDPIGKVWDCPPYDV